MYKNMADILSPVKNGDYAIEHFEIQKDNFGAMMQGIPEGKYVRLMHKGECVMSNTPMEERTNNEFVYNAFGDILIGGLGIGMILLAIQDDSEVTSITVIEKSKEVIDMVSKQLPLNSKVNIVEGDIFTYKPSKDEKYDIVYLDIWNWINEDVYREQMKPLKAKYRRYLKPKSENPKRKIYCWAEREAKTDRRLR